MTEDQYIDKIAAELLAKAEAELGRELTDLEKVAWVGTAMRLAGGLFKAIKPMLPKAMQIRAQNWGKAISTAYNRSKAQGLSPYNTARRVFGGAMKQDPVLTTGSISGVGYGLGKMTNKRQPMMPVYAAHQIIEELEKIAKDEENKKSNDKWLYAGAGAAVGLLLGMRNKRILAKLDEKELLDKTKHLRGIGDNLASKYKEFNSMRDEQFDSLFRGISDVKQKEKVKVITKDIDRLIKEVSNNVPKGVRKEDLQNELHTLINKAHEAGEIPSPVRDYLRKSVNHKLQISQQGAPLNGLQATKNNSSIYVKELLSSKGATSLHGTSTENTFRAVTPEDIFKKNPKINIEEQIPNQKIDFDYYFKKN